MSDAKFEWVKDSDGRDWVHIDDDELVEAVVGDGEGIMTLYEAERLYKALDRALEKHRQPLCDTCVFNAKEACPSWMMGDSVKSCHQYLDRRSK